MVATRELALEIIKRLKGAGHQALLAGGCVRDWLMGIEPKDHDVATSARPDEVKQLFERRTLAIGAAFGVIAVLSRQRDCQVEVATFRTDGDYLDGRRPESVTYSDARNDALRRDFTINGMFQDPESGEIFDYVDGRRDLEERVVRAIGDPRQRIEEDRLRMLRGVRFAARFGFSLEPATRAAIVDHAAAIRQVSGERIGAEMRRMLVHASRAEAARLLAGSGLLDQILPGASLLTDNRSNWRTRMKWLAGLGDSASFPAATAVLAGPWLRDHGAEALMELWKLSVGEARAIGWLEENWVTLLRGSTIPWSRLQPLLVHPLADEALQIASAAGGADQAGVRFCRQRLGWDRDRLDPAPWLDGRDLMQAGIAAGPAMGLLLRELRRAQLDGEINDRAAALQWAREWPRGPEATSGPVDLDIDDRP